MKTLLIILAIALSSCEICEECTTTYYDVNGQPTTSSTEEICGRKDIKQAEGDHSRNDGQTVTKWSTRCK